MIRSTLTPATPTGVRDQRSTVRLRFGYQVSSARKLAKLSQKALAKCANINVITLRRMEAAKDLPITGRRYSIQAVERALERAGVLLLEDGKSDL